MITFIKFITILASICLIWGIFIEPNLLFVKKYRLKSTRLQGLKIIFISDIHAGKGDTKRIDKIVKKTDKESPDLVFFGGDFIKGHEKNSSLPIKTISEKISKINSRYGIFSVLGNHDWYLDGHNVRKELEKNGITVLENENRIISINEKNITIAGVADDSTRQPDIEKTLSGSSDTIIFLTHSPDVFPDINTKIELALAGHTHGGQIVFPFLGAPITNSFYGQDYLYGLIEQNGNKMIVTKGVGTSVLPIRFFCAPEIVIVEFE